MSTNPSYVNKALFGLSLIAASLLMLFVSSPARAADFTVTNTNDLGPGSLRQAVTDANNTGKAQTIGFQSGLSGTITLTTDPLTITDPAGVTIDGGSAPITVRGSTSNLGNIRVFRVMPGGKLDLKNLTVDGGIAGSAGGGGVLNEKDSQLTVSNCTFSGNSAPLSSGGAILNAAGGVVAVTNSTFSGNSASSIGGGIHNNGTLSVINSTISGNSAKQAGGGILNDHGTVTATNTTFSANSVTDPTDQPHAGGGVFNDHGTVTVTNSTFSANSAAGRSPAGGGIFNREGGTVNLIDSTFSDNSATDPTGNTNPTGGGIDNAGTLTVTSSTFSKNSAPGAFSLGGGIFTSDGAQSSGIAVTVTNSTFSGNSASDGGGIFSDDKTKLTNSTFSGNGVSGSGGTAITVGPDPSSEAILRSTIVANTTESDNTTVRRSNCKGTITDGGYNIDDGTTCGFNPSTSTSKNTDPKLDPDGLKDNGGLTKTIALQDGSPAIDAIPSGTNGCGTDIATDQRGVKRPQDSDGNGTASCDIGAFELPEPPPSQPITTNEDTPKTITLTATDPNGNSLTFEITQAPSNGTLGPIGTATCTGTTTKTCSANVTYTPHPNYNGSDPFKFRTNDGTVNSAAATVFLTVNAVNDAPSFQLKASPDQTVNEDAGAQSVSGLVASFSAGPENESGQTVNFLVSNDNNALFSAQPAVSDSGKLTYTPAVNANGSATISVHAKDGGGTANGGVDASGVKTFTITVTPVNDAPVNTVPGNQSTNEDTALTFNSANTNLISTSDVDAGSSTLRVTLGASHGTLTLGNTGGLSFTSGDGSADPTMVFSGTISNIAVALSGLKFDPDLNYNGPDSLITITTDDQGNTGSGGAQSDTDTVSISVNAVNDAPVADPDPATTNEDTAAKINVLSNDTDVDGDSLTPAVVAGPAHGTADVITSGDDRGKILYTPAANYNGPDSFTYKASDGTLDSNIVTVNITVNPVNDAPTVAVAAGGSCDTSTKGTINLTIGDVETKAGDLILSSASSNLTNVSFGGSGANRTLTISAAAKRSGTATVTVTVSDDGDPTMTSSIPITVIVGTDASELFTGTDTINGLGGNDLIFGKNGIDTINGLGGNDLLCGGNGVGTMSGGAGDDTLDGANGNDVLQGDAGKDILRGSLGNDTLTGGADADKFFGGAGTDTVTDFTPAEGDTKDNTIP